MSVDGLRSVMAAPAIAPPLGSVTVPFNCALPKPCAIAGTKEATKTNAIAKANPRTKIFFITHLSDCECPISNVARVSDVRPCASTPVTLGPDPFLYGYLLRAILACQHEVVFISVGFLGVCHLFSLSLPPAGLDMYTND